MNTLRNGRYRWMIFKNRGSWMGTALEFNIVVEGDDPRVVETELHEAVIGYLESARKLKGVRDTQVNAILNQKAPAEYEERWEEAREVMKGNVRSPLSSDFFRAGVSTLALA